LACRILFRQLVLLSLVLLSLAQPLAAQPDLEVQVEGVTEELKKNVLARLAINQPRARAYLTPGSIRRLHRQAEEDIRVALAPFGYYNPQINAELSQTESGWLAVYRIDQGPPLRIIEVDVQLAGPGRDNAALQAAVAEFALRPGDLLDQQLYEREKRRLANAAFGEGFLDAAFPERAIRVNRAENSAVVRLRLDTGPQYLFGDTSGGGEVLRHGLLNRYLPYTAGEPYDPKKLFELQSILYRTDYFSRVAVRGRVDAPDGLTVPVELELIPPERRNKYSFGVGYATDTGVRGKVNWANRLLNDRGHRISAMLQIAELENIVGLRFDVPRGDPRYDSVSHQLGYQDKTWQNTTTRLLTAGVSLTHTGPRFNSSVGLELRDEVYDIGDTSGDSTLLLPSLLGGMVFADDLLHTQNGLKIEAGALGGVKGVVSDVNFLQLTGSAKGIISPFANWRLLGRGSLGVNLVDDIDSLPPSLRFYTGGDNSIRGYRYKSIGTEDSAGEVVGGRYLVVGSVELERVFGRWWSLAAFWDAGTASDDLTVDFYQGVGAGLRFRLPFGQIRADLASAITEDGQPFRFHLSVGGDL
jgi:translocation and assembly module TamA